MKVSVVVPIYNGARHVGALIDSLARQSMPVSEFEAVFVDDGSTDGTARLLDRAQEQHPWLCVIHQPNSGWPGKPRNVGIEAARGEYVFFADHDDWFGDEALERLHATATRTGADIVLGRMVGHGRNVPREVFRRNLDAATLEDAPLFDAMTPHKLFRRAFLNEHQLRFPEERRRLEDHVFVMRAYLLADRISVLADYDCYHHARRDDDTNVSFATLEPVGYYRSVREVLDLVTAHTKPGRVRNRVFRRYLRVELLSRLDTDLFAADTDYSRALWAQIRDVLVTRYPPEMGMGMGPRQRLLVDLLRRDAYDDAIAAIGWSRRVDATAVGAVTGSGVRLDLTVAVPHRELVSGADGRVRMTPPTQAPPTADLDVTEDLARAAVDVMCRRDDGAERMVAAEVAFVADGNGGLTGTADADLATLPRGTWQLGARVRVLGWSLQPAVRPAGESARSQLVVQVAGDGTLAAATVRAPRIGPGLARLVRRRIARIRGRR